MRGAHARTVHVPLSTVSSGLSRGLVPPRLRSAIGMPCPCDILAPARPKDHTIGHGAGRTYRVWPVLLPVAPGYSRQVGKRMPHGYRPVMMIAEKAADFRMYAHAASCAHAGKRPPQLIFAWIGTSI